MVLIKSDSPSVFMPWICYICTGGMEWLPLEISKINCNINPADLFWTLSNKCQDFSSSKYFWRTVCNVWLQTAIMLARVKYCTWVKIWKQKKQPQSTTAAQSAVAAVPDCHLVDKHCYWGYLTLSGNTWIAKYGCKTVSDVTVWFLSNNTYTEPTNVEFIVQSVVFLISDKRRNKEKGAHCYHYIKACPAFTVDLNPPCILRTPQCCW